MKKIILAFLFSSILYSQQVMPEWTARYNGPYNGFDNVRAMTIDNAPYVYVTGESYRDGTSDYATVKYTSSGVQLWASRFNGTGNGGDEPFAIEVDNSGNVYVTGVSYSISSYNIVTIKYLSSGSTQWVANYPGSSNMGGTGLAIAVDDYGNVYVAGVTLEGGQNRDFVTLKYNSNGILQWEKKYNGAYNRWDEARAICIDRSSNIVVTGVRQQTSSNHDYFTIKYNPNGDTIWTAIYDGPSATYSWDEATALALDSLDNVFVTGFSQGGGSLDDFATVKYDSAGNQQWVKRYGYSRSERPSSIVTDKNGNAYVTGYADNWASHHDFLTIKYNSAGTQQWAASFDGFFGLNDDAKSICVDTNFNVFITGPTQINDSSYLYATIKYNIAGIQQWQGNYVGNDNYHDIPVAIAVDRTGNVYVAGSSDSNGVSDYLTLKYSYITRIDPISTEIPNQFSLSQNYPNPFNPVTKIKFDTPPRPSPKGRGQWVKLIIYDILGREVAVLINEELNPGTYEVNWDAGNYPSGVYFYKLTAADASASLSFNYSETKKMVLIK
jgi:uncharacterized delta-60 repeat protein